MLIVTTAFVAGNKLKFHPFKLFTFISVIRLLWGYILQRCGVDAIWE